MKIAHLSVILGLLALSMQCEFVRSQGGEGPEGGEGREGEGREGEGEGPEGEGREGEDGPEDNHDEHDEHEDERHNCDEHADNPNAPLHEGCTRSPTLSPTDFPTSIPTTPQPTFIYTIDFEGTVETKVYPSDGNTNDMYGSHVHIHHTTAVVGAYGASEFGDKSGAVYIYATNATKFPYYDDGSTPWYFVQKLHLEQWKEKCDKDGCIYELDEKYSKNSEFGYSAALWNDTIIVGAHKHADAHDEGGGAFVFNRYATGMWSQTAILSAGDGHDNQNFGSSIAMYEDTAVIGAIGDDHAGTSSGCAYMFGFDSEYGTWMYKSKLTSENPDQFDCFGASLAIYKGTLVAGAPGDEELGADAGAAYIFSQTNSWGQVAKLTAYESSVSDEDAYAHAKFGCSVGIYDQSVVVGAYYAHGHWDNAGGAYIFTQDSSSGTWSLQHKIIAQDGMTEDKFGWTVAIYKDTVVVGAYGEQGKEKHHRRALQGGAPGGEGGEHDNKDDKDREHEGENCGPNSPPDCQQFEGHYSYRGSNNGAAYIFARSGSAWNQEFKLLPNDTEAYDAFGYSADLHENVLFVGAYLSDGVEEDTGAAYIYAPETMSPKTKGTSGEVTYYAITGEVGLDALLAVCLILVPAAIGGVWYYTEYKKNQVPSDRMPVSTDSQHGSVAPWSMHGAFDDSSRGEGSRSLPTRSPLRGPPVARGL